MLKIIIFVVIGLLVYLCVAHILWLLAERKKDPYYKNLRERLISVGTEECNPRNLISRDYESYPYMDKLAYTAEKWLHRFGAAGEVVYDHDLEKLKWCTGDKTTINNRKWYTAKILTACEVLFVPYIDKGDDII